MLCKEGSKRFELEEEASCAYDALNVDGIAYCGSSGPDDVALSVEATADGRFVAAHVAAHTFDTSAASSGDDAESFFSLPTCSTTSLPGS